jgi:small GTP-binding protein
MSLPDPMAHKVVFIGPASAGKTSLITRFSKGTFRRDQAPTIGAGYLPCELAVQGEHVELDIWDTAGQERFRSLVPQYSRGASAVILVFDLSSLDSFTDCRRWLGDTRQNHPSASVLWFLVGNKCDEPPAVSIAAIRQWASQQSLIYIHMSAKTGENVHELFEEIASRVPRRHGGPRSGIVIGAASRERGCC